MNTHTHVLLNQFIFKKKVYKKPVYLFSILIGSILPDMPIVFMAFWCRFIQNKSWQQIWSVEYYSKFWSYFINLFNSIPIFSFIALIIFIFIKYTKKYPTPLYSLFLFSISTVLHCVQDIFLHVEDSHRHFLPLSNYIYVSKVSYWDPNYYGIYFSAFEVMLFAYLAYKMGNIYKYKFFKYLVYFLSLVNIIIFSSLLIYNIYTYK